MLALRYHNDKFHSNCSACCRGALLVKIQILLENASPFMISMILWTCIWYSLSVFCWVTTSLFGCLLFSYFLPPWLGNSSFQRFEGLGIFACQRWPCFSHGYMPVWFLKRINQFCLVSNILATVIGNVVVLWCFVFQSFLVHDFWVHPQFVCLLCRLFLVFQSAFL